LPSGHLKGDLTVMRLAEDKFMITGSGYLQEFHMLWFEQHVQGKDVRIANRSDEFSAIAIAGPQSRELLSLATSGDLGNESVPFMSVRSMDVGNATCRVARLSFTGELGYEIYIPGNDAQSIYDHLFEVGAKLGVKPFGIRALVSMGMEKSFGIWSREFTPDYTPAMCGLDRFIDYDKTDFVGREAALKDREATQERRLVALEVDSSDADAWGYEPIWHENEIAGYVTSGAYGHTVGKSLALAYLETRFLGSPDNEFSVHIVDKRMPARILPEPPHDPSGSLMRS